MRVTAQSLIDIKPQLADFLSNLEVGDSVRGRIVELLGESISLRTASGQMFTAALMTDADLKQGQTIELIISNISEDGVFAELKSVEQKPVKMNEDTKLQQALMQMDIRPDKENLQAAKLLIKYGMPITKDNVLHLINTQKSLETMAKADIVKVVSLMQSEKDINNTEVTKLAKQTMALEPKTEQALKLLQKETVKVVAPKDNKAEPQKPIVGNDAIHIEKNPELLKAARESKADTSQIQLDRRPIIENSPKQALHQLVEQLDNKELQRTASKVERLIDTIVKVFENVSKLKPEQTAYLMSKDMKVTPAAVKALTGNGENQGKLGTQIKELEKLIDALEQNKADVRELKQSVKKLFLKPEVLNEKEHIQENLKELVKTAGKLEALIKSHNLEDKVDKSVLSDIKANLDFQQNISNNVNYIQIPLLINENKTTADIYVFNNKKRGKAINSENASILIALDLVNLGHIESLVSVSKKNVSVTFKVEKEQFKQVLLDNIQGLKLALEARGYNLNSIQAIDMAERFNLLELEEVSTPKPDSMHLDVKV